MTRTDEGLAMLKAIIAVPDDDTVRLVYADWLDENGDEIDKLRARMIRFGHHRRTNPYAPFDRDEASELSIRAVKHELELLERGACERRPGDDSVVSGLYASAYIWTVGFVDRMRMNIAAFGARDCRFPRALVMVHPVREIVISCREPTPVMVGPLRGGWYCWHVPRDEPWRLVHQGYRARLPSILRPYLTGRTEDSIPERLAYQTDDAAKADLYRATCLCARDLVKKAATT